MLQPRWLLISKYIHADTHCKKPVTHDPTEHIMLQVTLWCFVLLFVCFFCLKQYTSDDATIRIKQQATNAVIVHSQCPINHAKSRSRGRWLARYCLLRQLAWLYGGGTARSRTSCHEHPRADGTAPSNHQAVAASWGVSEGLVDSACRDESSTKMMQTTAFVLKHIMLYILEAVIAADMYIYTVWYDVHSCRGQEPSTQIKEHDRVALSSTQLYVSEKKTFDYFDQLNYITKQRISNMHIDTPGNRYPYMGIYHQHRMCWQANMYIYIYIYMHMI